MLARIVHRSSLVALLAAVLLATAASAAVPTSPPLGILGPDGGLKTLSRLHPLTLAPQGPSAPIPEWHEGYSISPDRSSAAFTVSTNPAPSVPGTGRAGVRIVDLATMETKDVRTGVAAGAVAWLAPNRLIAVLQGNSVPVIDPVAGVVLSADGRIGGDCIDPPNQGVTRRALVVMPENRLYTIGPDGRPRGVTLRGFPRHCWRAGMAVDSAGERAFVADTRGTTAEVNLRTLRVTYRRVAASRASRVDRTQAIWLAGSRLAVAHSGSHRQPKGVELVDARAGTRRTLVAGASGAAVTSGRLIVRGGAGEGLTIFDLRGRRLVRLLGGERFHDVDVAGRFAYARGDRGLRVVDVREGRVVGRTAPGPRGELTLLR